MIRKKYTKAEIINSAYKKTRIERQDIRAIMDFVFDDIKAALIEGKVIEIRGLGTFEVKIRKGRQKARNPRTGEMISVNSHGIAHFRAGHELRQGVWNLNREKTT